MRGTAASVASLSLPILHIHGSSAHAEQATSLFTDSKEGIMVGVKIEFTCQANGVDQLILNLNMV